MNNDIKAKIIAKAWKDPTFKKKLLENPRAAFEEMGVTFQENYNVRCIEDKENTLTFVLPAQPSNAKNLSEVELSELVSGGWSGWFGCPTGTEACGGPGGCG